MDTPAQKILRSAAADTVSANVLRSQASPDAASKKLTRRQARGSTSPSSAKVAKQLAADQKKDDRLRSIEVEQRETDDRFTSPDFIRAVEESFGEIDFDPCWHEASAVRPKAYLDVRQGHNGLRDAWYGRLIFVNPPWSAQDKWVKRAYSQWKSGNVKTVVCLVPAKTETKFFHNTLINEADLYFIEGRPLFFKKAGTYQATMVATMLVIFGATDEQKARFAERVRGAWWLPSQRSWGRTEEAQVSEPEASKHFGLLSCSAPSGHKDADWIVFCNPSVGRSQTARLA